MTIYREALSFESIKSLANCESLSSRNLIIDWFISSYQLKGDINVEDKSKSSFCKKNTLSDLALFNHGATHDYIKFMCDKLGGQLPTLGNVCFVHPVFCFWSLLATKLRKHYVIFVYILQGKMGKTGKNRKENHATKVTKIPKTKRRKYGMNKT